MPASRLTSVLAVLLAVALLAPLALVEPPPLLDWPNHLARGWLLGGGLDNQIGRAHV